MSDAPKPSCATCRFGMAWAMPIHWYGNPADMPKDRPTTQAVVYCRRRAPVVGEGGQLFPTLLPSGWCGEHEPTVAP